MGVSKIHAELIEQEFVNLYYSVFKTTPEGNKRPIPDRMRGRTRKKFDDISPDKLKKVKDYIKQFMK